MTPAEQKAFDAMRDALERVSAVDDDCDILSPSLSDAVTDALKEANALNAEPLKVSDLGRYALEPQAPYANCRFRICDLPGQCKGEGKCHHPAVPQAQADSGRSVECAKRLVEHADFQLGGILSSDSKAKDIPSKAVSKVKSRHLAALRDALPAAPEAKQ